MSLHLPHHVSPVCLHGDLAAIQLTADLPVQQAANHQGHDLNNTSSPYGLVKNSTAAAFIARTAIGTSQWPVMNMIGMSIRSVAMRFCRSKPLRPGSATSNTRHLGTWVGGRGIPERRRISVVASLRTESANPAIRAPKGHRQRRTRWVFKHACTHGLIWDPRFQSPVSWNRLSD
jgi:hypothetical protein